MLHLILGRSGAGKTTRAYDICREKAAENQAVILLIPEQDSFAAERAMLRIFGEQRHDAVDVLSFTRLADAVFRACGGRHTRVVTENQRALTMCLALDAARGKLEIFRNADERLVPQLLLLADELRQSAKTSDQLRMAAQSLHAPASQKKLAELCLILDAFNALTAKNFGGQGDVLDELLQTIKTTKGRAFFAEKTIVMDSFLGFTGQERAILRHVIASAKDVYCTLCMDTLYPLDDTASVFAHAKRTAADLLDLATQAETEKSIPQVLSAQNLPRFHSEALAYLEEAMLCDRPAPFTQNTDDITLCSCEDIEAECAFVAANIKSLLRDEGTRCRDIAIVARQFAGYEHPMQAALTRAGVPVFRDKRQNVAMRPLMLFVSSALAIAAEGFTLENVMRWMKTDLVGVSQEECAMLDEYASLWHIQGAQWTKPWTMHPDGLGLDADNARTREELSIRNAIRLRAVTPLEAFQSAMRDCTGKSGAKAVFHLLQSLEVPQSLQKTQKNMQDANQIGDALELSRVWDVLMEMLDALADTLGNAPLGAKRFADTFALLLSLQTLGTLPQGLDAITMGAADRIRLNAPRVVFVVGFNDGVFPQTPQINGLLADSERRNLLQCGLPLRDTAPQEIAMERLLLYRALSSARERLCVTWARRSGGGEELAPSSYAAWLKRVFPNVALQDTLTLDPMTRLDGEEAGFALLCETQRTGGSLHASLLDYFKTRPHYAARLDALNRCVSSQFHTFAIDDLDVAEKLFRKNMTLSVSRAQTYAKCPFQYFCRYGLKAKTRAVADFDPALRGNVIHSVFEELLQTHSADALLAMNPADRLTCLNACLDAYAARFFAIESIPERVRFLFRRLRQIIAQVFERMMASFEASAFRPVDFELPIDRDAAVRPYEIALHNGGILRLRGKIDRVDMADIDGKTYFRVIDYKSGAQEFSLSDAFSGLQLQMLVYLFALWESKTPPYANALPAGVIYTIAADPPLRDKQRDKSEETIAQDKRGVQKDQGLLLKDDAILMAVGKETIKFDTLTLLEFRNLKNEIDTVLIAIAECLQNGEIPALPANATLCDYCAFASVCGRERGDSVREVEKLNFDEARERLHGGMPHEMD
ncbi:MAG: PD-(D/E)XK nuclease family protein [Oscillospiraceae bacterium]|nr:PD-(D/E)XK nuclease family protein [Oscillospiraceae bacterium]